MGLGKGYRVLLALGVLFFSSLAVADTLVVGGPITGTTLTIQDSALTALNSGWSNGVTAYIDPYNGKLNGNSVVLFCIDPDHLDNNIATGYAVNVSPNGTGNNTLQALNLTGSVLPFSHVLSAGAISAGFTNASDLYGGLAYLSQQLQGTTNTLLRQEYQAAIWQLADYTSTFAVLNAPQGFNSGLVTQFEHDAWSNRLTSGFSVLTDANETTNGIHAGQEYIILTPEPSPALLFACGVFGFFMLRHRQSAVMNKA